ncbi:MAG: DedA family protein [Actinomycetota bacterium]|nr:DedA family protein [Actinomycetota bacterium]
MIAPTGATAPTRRLPSFRVLLAGALGILALLWIAPTVTAAVSAIDLDEVDNLYAIIGGFVVLDAVIPIFPSESLLTTASNLAAQSDSSIVLWRLIVAGSIGAVIGDSLLYWLARTVLRPFMSGQVERASRNEKVARSMEVLGRTAPLLIVFGRFVPGLRFMLGATMGLTRYPYPRFLGWDALGGTLWASFNCVFSYLVASIIEDQPIVSIVVSVLVTTALLGLLYHPIKRNWEATAPDEPAPDPDPAAQAASR